MIQLKKIWFIYVANFWMRIKLFLAKKRFTIGSNIKFRGFPNTEVMKGAHVLIGHDVLINSWNTGYHISMYRPVKIVLHSDKARLKIGNHTRIHGSCIHVKSKVDIGDNCLIAANTQIFDCNGHLTAMSDPSRRLKEKDIPKEIVIHNNVWIGTGCVILPGSTIGNGSVIGAGSVVSGSIPPNSIAKGNPAVVLENNK